MLSTECPLGGLFRTQRPRSVKGQIRVLVGQILIVGQSGGRILGSKTRNMPSRGNSLADSLRGKISGRRSTALLPVKNCNTERTRARLLNVFRYLSAHGNS